MLTLLPMMTFDLNEVRRFLGFGVVFRGCWRREFAVFAPTTLFQFEVTCSDVRRFEACSCLGADEFCEDGASAPETDARTVDEFSDTSLTIAPLV